MVEVILPRLGSEGAKGHGAILGFGLSRLALLGAALLLARRAPEMNAYPAAALTGALLLDGAGRLAGALAARRSGIATGLRGFPSLVLALGESAGLALAALALAVRPDAFPVLASALAGLVTIGAAARIALARIVLRLGRERSPQERDADLTGR